ncbi:J domain-containing protein [Roseimicrobium sp. ORNL1]|uniref:J domain-containing protein n=1 Tax=Roseimicrobium sp. ORNL1 TaxID=2711231 RepID=UPI0013E1B9BA|nr:J domain-containing protein [Roseimicrobium sp. ORNL1]QIF00546.1 J domain-containing protein [Roseimicrobium sp. ORNL1]
MNDPWQILILDRHTATEKDVKAAYARLLKQHRPDSDPEGFRRVRGAYEAALDWLRNRATNYNLPEVSYADAGTTDPNAAAGTEGKDGNQGNRLDLPVVFEDFPLPADAKEALAEVEHAAQTGNVEQLEAALKTFQERCEAGSVSGASRTTALERAFNGRINDLASAVTNSFLIRLAELGQTNISHLVISAWQERDDRGRLVQFSRALMDHARTLATPDGAFLLARVGVLTGLEQPEMASTLANAAYPHLPVDARNHLMAQLEQEAALGKIFAEVSPSMKPFWFRRVRQAGEKFDWNSPEARKALNDVIERNRYVWEGWGVVRQLMPPANWALVEHRLNNQVQQVHRQTGPKKVPGWALAMGVLFFINMLRFMATDRPSSSYSSPDTSRRPERVHIVGSNATDWTHRQPLTTTSSSPSGGEGTRMPLGGMPPLLPTTPMVDPLLPPPSSETQKKQEVRDLLEKGVMQDSVLQMPPAPQPSPLFPTR